MSDEQAHSVAIDGAGKIVVAGYSSNGSNYDFGLVRYHGDGAQWNAGIGEIVYKKLGWRRAAIIMDDYSFGWTSAAGIIADFCAIGGQITKRVFPPLNTTDYSSYVRQLPRPGEVDGYFWVVGGTGTDPDAAGIRARTGNHEVIGRSEMYSSEAAARNDIESVKKNCAPSFLVIRQIAASRVVSSSRCARKKRTMPTSVPWWEAPIRWTPEDSSWSRE